ncbi:MAG: tRNA pseudouridine(38-40) synthase TruA [Omnitrophica bacterium GWA2_41_15]|nr:MAG: tRNA pseudouridine(38-40) synthase TruA [Omnitrophica bacterium GWA2_41_15]HAZ09573.1 tRNA pseudouridine(38-40) synthase TruA [Candidatus Omnitrophota bacterium]
MRNIKLIIEYDGTGFNGWQAQVNGKRLRTIQEEIEKAAKKLFGKKISLIGSSRTDSGVHAKAYVANFRIDSKLELTNIKNGLNSFLPRQISIISSEEVTLKFHSRIDSIGKLYKYTIINRKSRSPLLERYSALVPYDLDLTMMRRAAKYLIGKKDFKSFRTGNKKEKSSSVRTVKKIEIISRAPTIEIHIQADGFLYNMARNIAGTLIEVGRGRFKPEQVKEILAKRHRSSAGKTAPAKGLCLEKVFY